MFQLLLVLGLALPETRDVSDLLQPIRERHDLPGLAGAVVQGRQLVACGAAGVRRRGGEAPLTTADRFHLGSCTKSMTATMIATLVEEKKLSWTTTIGEVFPELAEQMKPAWKAVTIEELLTHRAGAPAGLDANGLWGRLWKREGSPREQRMTLVRGVLERDPEAPPGTKFIYSNAGFAIAGAMAERITNEAWEDLMRERLFRPLGMTSAGFGAPGTPGKLDEPLGHGAKGDPVDAGPNADNPPAIGPAGTVHCTLGDWAKYVSLHLEGERGAKDALALLGPDDFRKLHAPAPSSDPQDTTKYAMGWGLAERGWSKGPVLTHSGSNTMWFCVTWLAPEEDFAVLVATNQGGDDAAKGCDEAAWALIQDHLKDHAGAKH